MAWSGGSYLNILTIFILFNAMKQVKPHVQSSLSSELSEEGLLIEEPPKKTMRRSSNVVAQEWNSQSEGLPIDFPNRRDFSMAANEIIKQPIYTMPPTMSTTRSTSTPVYPPLDRRFRRIYNPDEVASIEDYPYMAALLVNNELWCGAVIIDTDKILTAAHCLQLQYNNRFFREYVKMLTVRVGSTNATSGGELLRVSEIFFHPNYKPQTLEFNFAVLRTHKNMTFGRKDPYIEKINFSRDKVVPVDNHIMFLGWGSVLGISGAGGQVLLQKLKIPVYDGADCQEIYGKDLVTRTNFCAGYITIAKNVCNHDAGGPAIMDGALIGVLSFSSKRCDTADQPAVFSTVGAVADWLDNLGEKKTQLRTTAIKIPEMV
ncbi:trypsin-7-like [Trichoplusia ni]|uniref:Trypsin-7-like n=1 Tax=Trichoplusia ni TaxID=7111 RepID=A0A7E5VH04_TRINI|nr:trypsin-7-like [Trichoplusia ni]XP_026727523.1 trypsin-7-like [Trichoplusia ni]XP_026727524.1 trypsin-7-like [Trichoplusia ni]